MIEKEKYTVILGGSIMGYIYRIYCDLEQITNCYIGKTTRTVEKRFQEHVSDAMNQNKKYKLHNAMNKYGIDHFHYEILGEYPNDELDNQEIYWIEYYNSYYNGWNSTIGGDGNIYWTENMKQQQSQIMKQYYASHEISESTKQKLSQKMTERWKDPDYKKRLQQSQLKSYETNPNRRLQQQQNTLNRYKNPEEREKSSLAQQKRWANPEEHKKASLAHIKSQGKKVRCIETGIIYNCIADANEALGKKRTSTSINSCLKGTYKTAYGYHWERIEE